jgi:hypothetical protein
MSIIMAVVFAVGQRRRSRYGRVREDKVGEQKKGRKLQLYTILVTEFFTKSGHQTIVLLLR